ncbi:hypothetical protein APASM_4220 [Actinosynnema pretiosum subsp. pretiosum]|nr:hypothetical protein APASM_4220 [Actinosynnema pretiosum subsp. pretiosum]
MCRDRRNAERTTAQCSVGISRDARGPRERTTTRLPVLGADPSTLEPEGSPGAAAGQANSLSMSRGPAASSGLLRVRVRTQGRHRKGSHPFRVAVRAPFAGKVRGIFHSVCTPSGGVPLNKRTGKTGKRRNLQSAFFC